MLGLYDAIAAKLAADAPSLLQVVTGQQSVEAVEMLALGPDVTALVHPISDRADPLKTAAMIVSQRVTERFGVTMCLVFPGGFPQFETAREEIKTALRGWAPAGASLPVEYAGGRTLQYELGQDGGRWLHLLEFSVPAQETYEHQS
jgi:hypothetical protein